MSISSDAKYHGFPWLKAELLITTLFISACATESRRSVTPQVVETYNTQYSGEKFVLVVGRFQNRSNYLQGIFSSNADQLGNQAKTILKTHLQQTNRFTVVDRENMCAIVGCDHPRRTRLK